MVGRASHALTGELWHNRETTLPLQGAIGNEMQHRRGRFRPHPIVSLEPIFERLSGGAPW
jgi:hypothetical protein